MLEQAVDGERLAGLEVYTDANGQAGVLVEAVVSDGGHGGSR
jgi:hypothetical protein